MEGNLKAPTIMILAVLILGSLVFLTGCDEIAGQALRAARANAAAGTCVFTKTVCEGNVLVTITRDAECVVTVTNRTCGQGYTCVIDRCMSEQEYGALFAKTTSEEQEEQEEDVPCALAGYSCAADFVVFDNACEDSGGTSTQGTTCVADGVQGVCAICITSDSDDVNCDSGYSCYSDVNDFVCEGTKTTGSTCKQGGVDGTCVKCVETDEDIPCDADYTCYSDYEDQAKACEESGGQYTIEDTCRVGSTEGKCVKCSGLKDIPCDAEYTCYSDYESRAKACVQKGGQATIGAECRVGLIEGKCVKCSSGQKLDGIPCDAEYACYSDYESRANACVAEGGEYTIGLKCKVGSTEGKCFKCSGADNLPDVPTKPVGGLYLIPTKNIPEQKTKSGRSHGWYMWENVAQPVVILAPAEGKDPGCLSFQGKTWCSRFGTNIGTFKCDDEKNRTDNAVERWYCGLDNPVLTACTIIGVVDIAAVGDALVKGETPLPFNSVAGVYWGFSVPTIDVCSDPDVNYQPLRDWCPQILPAGDWQWEGRYCIGNDCLLRGCWYVP